MPLPDIPRSLLLEPFQPIQVSGKNFLIKLVLDEGFTSILTDLAGVWYCNIPSEDLMSSCKDFNGDAVKIADNNVKSLYTMIESFFTQAKYKDHERTAETQKGFLTMKTSMLVSNCFTFRWEFKFRNYGTKRDHREFIWNHYVLPMNHMLNAAFNLNLPNAGDVSLKKHLAVHYSNAMKKLNPGEDIDLDAFLANIEDKQIEEPEPCSVSLLSRRKFI